MLPLDDVVDVYTMKWKMAGSYSQIVYAYTAQLYIRKQWGYDPEQ